MRARTRYINANSLSGIKFLSGSQECHFIEMLAYLDTKQSYGNGEVIRETDLLEKLFINIKNGEKVDKPLDKSETLFLKNKYLYLYTEGAYYYLQALHSMEQKNTNLSTKEKAMLTRYIERFREDFVLVSLGSATAEKEIKCLSDFCDLTDKAKFTFMPIDVSATLIQLAILNFDSLFHARLGAKIDPVIADFWDLPEHSNKLFNNYKEQHKIFTLFGTTIGNYREKALLKIILEIMKEGDILLIGIDTLGPEESTEDAKTRIHSEYNTIGNFQFLLNPLVYIPRFKGYIDKYAKYFQFDKRSSFASYSPNDQRSLSLTNIPESICYAPLFNIPRLRDRDSSKEDDFEFSISIAQSTKYRLNQFIKFITDHIVSSPDDQNKTYKFDFEEHYTPKGFNSDDNNDPYCDCVVFKKKFYRTDGISSAAKKQELEIQFNNIIEDENCTKSYKDFFRSCKPVVQNLECRDSDLESVSSLIKDLHPAQTDHARINMIREAIKKINPNALV